MTEQGDRLARVLDGASPDELRRIGAALVELADLLDPPTSAVRITCQGKSQIMCDLNAVDWWAEWRNRRGAIAMELGPMCGAHANYEIEWATAVAGAAVPRVVRR